MGEIPLDKCSPEQLFGSAYPHMRQFREELLETQPQVCGAGAHHDQGILNTLSRKTQDDIIARTEPEL